MIVITMRASELSAAGLATFVSTIGGVYENSPWIAEKAFARGPFNSLSALAEGLKSIVDEASAVRPYRCTNVTPASLRETAVTHCELNTAQEEQTALLCAHPDLAGKAALAGDLTAESTSEQKSAGLNSLTPDELARFTKMNDEYRSKYKFPFVLAVRNASKRTILNAFTTRLKNSPGQELAEGIAQVHKIAWMRLRDIVEAEPTGKLTCHVLDTARGKPAAGMLVSLRKLVNDNTWELVGDFETNSDGRLNGPALQGEQLKAGVYEWTFDVGDYFASAAVPTAGTPFLKQVHQSSSLPNTLVL